MSSRRKVAPAVAVGPMDLNADELITVQPPVINHSIRQGLNKGSSRSSDNKADDARKEKRAREKKREVGPACKKSRKDSGPDESRTKGKNTVVLREKPVCSASGEKKVVVAGGRVDPLLRNHPILGDVAKVKFENGFANYRIPKISQRHPPDPQSRDPQPAVFKPNQAEKRKMDVMDKESVVEPQKKKTNNFDLRKLLAAPSAVIPTPVLWPERRHAFQRGCGHQEHKDRELYDSRSSRNKNFISKQAVERKNYRDGFINDGRHSHPNTERDFHFQGREMPPRDPVWNDPRLRVSGYPVGAHPGSSAGIDRMQRFDMIQPPPVNPSFKVRPEEDRKEILINKVPREIRFYGDKAIILTTSDEPRRLCFQTCVRRIIFDNVLSVDCTVGNDYMDFYFDGQHHKIKIGAPTREVYIDGNWYECKFGGPPITIYLGGRPVQVVLQGLPPALKIGTERRLDLLPERGTMIINARNVISFYLDLKLQHFKMDGRCYTMQFKDALRTVIIDGNRYSVDFGGLQMRIYLDGRKHFVRFSSLPRGVEPGCGLQPWTQTEDNKRVLNEEQSSNKTLCTGNDIGQLLSKLVEIGLLPASASTPEAMKPASFKEETKKEEAIRVVDFANPECMQVRPNDLISMLYSGKQCGICGLRFPADNKNGYRAHLDWHFQENRRKKNDLVARLNKQCGSCGLQFTADQIDEYSAHLDWHFQQNRKKKKQYHWSQNSGTTAAATLQPSSSASDLIHETEGSQLNWFEAQAKEKSESNKPKPMISVAVGTAPEDNRCFVCHEKLDEFFHEENEEWHLKDAVRVDGITFHPLCHQDHLSKVETWNAFGL